MEKKKTMNKELIKYFEDGITINKLPSGKYSIFTTKTQRFTVDKLEDLTPQSFEYAIKKLQDKEIASQKMMEDYTKKIKQKEFKEKPILDINSQYFRTILDLPRKNKITTKDGEVMDVGDIYTIEFNNGGSVDVYIASLEMRSKKKDDLNVVITVIEKTGMVSPISIGQIKRTVKSIKQKK